MNTIAMSGRKKARVAPNVARVFLLTGLVTLSGGAAPIPPSDSDGPPLRVVNPFPPGALPAIVRLKLLDRDGKPLAALERKVDEMGFIAGVPAIPGVQRISADAELFDTTTTLLAVARESGIVLLPYGRLAISGFADPSGPRMQGDARLWLRRRLDGRLVRRTEPIGPENSVVVSIPGGEWDVVLKVPAKAPVAAMANLVPMGEARLSLDRATPGLSVSIRSVQADGKKPVPRASVRWTRLRPLTLREATEKAGPTPGKDLLADAVNEDLPTTDSLGRLRVEHLPLLPHVWTLTAEGFRKARESVEIRANDAQKVVTVAMRPSPDILVRVEDRGMTPARLAVDVSARAPGADTGLPLRNVWTGAVAPGAAQRLQHVKEADYRFDLRDESKVLLTQIWISPTDKIWIQDVIPVTLVREPRFVRGKASRGNEPAVGVFLYADVQTRGGPEVEALIPAEVFFDRAARTGPDGSYSLAIGGPGIYRIRYTIPDENIDGTAGTADLTAATSVDLDFSIALNRLAIEVISAKDGKPIPSAELRVTLWKSNDRRGSSYDARTDDQGRYAAGGLEDVRATIRVSADGFETRIVEIPLGDPEPEPGSRKVELQPVGSLRFRIGDPRGVPIPAVEVVTLEEPGPLDLEPIPVTVAQADATGLAVVENPGADSRPYFFLARGWGLELIPAQASEDNPEIPVALTPIQVTYPLRIRRATGEPFALIALAFRRSGVVYPWSLLGIKIRQEGRDYQSTLVTDAEGRIPIHELLAPGAYETYLFIPADMRTRMRHQSRYLAPLTLPLQTETTLTIPRGQNRGAQR